MSSEGNPTRLHPLLRGVLMLLVVALLAYGWSFVPGLVDAIYGYQSQPELVEVLRTWLGPPAG